MHQVRQLYGWYNLSEANSQALASLASMLPITKNAVNALQEKQTAMNAILQRHNETVEHLKRKVNSIKEDELTKVIDTFHYQGRVNQRHLALLNKTIESLNSQMTVHQGRIEALSQNVIELLAAQNGSVEKQEELVAVIVRNMTAETTVLKRGLETVKYELAIVDQRLNVTTEQLLLADKQLKNHTDARSLNIETATEEQNELYKTISAMLNEQRKNFTEHLEMVRATNAIELSAMRANVANIKTYFKNCSCDSVSSVQKRACDDEPCFPGVECFDLQTAVDRKYYRCSACPVGMFGTGETCDVYHVGAKCRSVSGLHFVTFDSLAHDFYGKCEYTLAKDCIDNDFKIHVEIEDFTDINFAWPKAVAIGVPKNNFVIRLWGNGSISVNNVEVHSLPYVIKRDNSIISRSHSVITVRLGLSGVILRWTPMRLVELSVPPAYSNRTCGLCGQYNGKAEDDLEAADGHVYSPSTIAVPSWSGRSRLAYLLFGRSWSVEGCERLLIPNLEVCVDGDAPPPAPCSVANTEYATAQAYCSVIMDRRGPYASCHSHRNPASAYRSCLHDVCACRGETACACDVLLSYETQCRDKGIQNIETVIDKCGVCFGDGTSCLTDGATCQVFGDSHYRTFDNSGHHFQGACEYVLAKDCLWNDFEIHIQNEHRNIDTASIWRKAVAIRIPEVGVIHLSDDHMPTVNSTVIETYPYVVRKDGTVISQTFGKIEVYLASSGVVVKFDANHFVEVTVPNRYQGRLCGLCGDFDRRWTNDFVTDYQSRRFVNTSDRYYSSSNQSLQAYLEFGKSWAVREGCGRLLLSDKKTCLEPHQSPAPPCVFQSRLQTKGMEYCDAITNGNGPYSKCRDAVDSSLYYQSCLHDACACDDVYRIPECVCGVIKAYETACRNHRISNIGTVIDKCGKCFTDGNACSRQGAICQAFSGLHYVTFDGSGHHFQGKCEYVLVKDCLDDEFQVNVKNEHSVKTGVTLTRSVAIKISGVAVIRLSSGNTNTTTVNNIPLVVYPYTIPGDGSIIERFPGRVQVMLASSGITIAWDGVHLVEVHVPLTYRDRTCGLCGVYDGVYSNDLELRNGTEISASDMFYSKSQTSTETYHTFGKSWTVTDDESLLADDTHETCVDETPGTDPCILYAQSESSAETYCRFINDSQGPYANCHAVVNPGIHYHACIYDYCLCGGNRNCTCQAVEAYENLCRLRGAGRVGSVVDKCGVCFGDGNSCQGSTDTCIAFGDPHYRTFDGSSHDFQGHCEYVLVREKNSAFTITARNIGQSVTYTRAIGINVRNIGNFRLESGPSVSLNGIKITIFPYYVVRDGTTVWLTVGGVRVYLGNSGLQIVWNGVDTVQIISPVSLLGKLSGLCGEYDGNTTNDFTGPDGTVYSSYHKFGLSWSVFNTDRIIIDPTSHCSDPVQPPLHPCDVNPQGKAKAEHYCNYIKNPTGPYGPCHASVQPDPQYESCVYDVCHCGGDEECACDVVKAYETVCRDAGIQGLGSVIDECGVCFGSGPPCQPDTSGFNTGATCSVSGAYHYRTFDGAWHHFQGLCEYDLATDCVSQDFVIHERNGKCGSMGCTRSIGIRLMTGDVIKLLQERVVNVNGMVVNLPFDVGHSARILQKGTYVFVTLAARNGSTITVRFDGKHNVDVALPSTYYGRVCGLCGTFTGTLRDDLELPNGSITTDTHTFGLNWAVEPQERLLLSTADTSCKELVVAPPHACDGKPAVRAKAEAYCALISDKQGPYADCHKVQDPAEYYGSCVNDVCECDADLDCACDLVKAYEHACYRQGISNRIGSVVDECGKCFGNAVDCSLPYSSAHSFGSSHYMTFDGLGHHFQGESEYLLCKDCKKSEFAIHVKNEHRGDAEASWTKTLGIRVTNGPVIKLLKGPRVFVNDKEMRKFPYLSPSGNVVIRRMGRTIKVYLLSIEVVISFHDKHFCEVAVSQRYRNRVCGLFGNFNSNPDDDLTGADGLVWRVSDSKLYNSSSSLPSYDEFGRSWAVPLVARLLLSSDSNFTEIREPKINFCDTNLDIYLKAGRYCQFITSEHGPYAKCHTVLDPSFYYQSCLYDTCSCNGSVECACAVAEAYESACRRLGINGLGTVLDECGVCFGDGTTCPNYFAATCQVHGHSHYITFDRSGHHFQGKCEYILAKDCVDNEWQVNVRNKLCKSQYTCVQSVAIRAIGAGVIKLYRGLEVTVNGLDVTSFPYFLAGDGSIIRKRFENLEVVLASSRVRVTWDGLSRVAVSVSLDTKNKTCGLCSSFNGNWQDDLKTRNGTQFDG